MPDRKSWRTLRDKAGGKKGLSKVDIGDALDSFHAALDKAEKSDDLVPLVKAINSLDKTFTSYANDVKKLGGQEALLKAVKTQVTDELDAFSSALEQMAKKVNEAIGKSENRIRTMLEMVDRSIAQIDKEMNGMSNELSGIAEKYKMGVPRSDLTNLAKQAAMRTIGVKAALKELDNELLSVVAEVIKTHRSVIDDFHSDLGKAKGKIKKSSETIASCSAKLTEIGILLKTVVG